MGGISGGAGGGLQGLKAQDTNSVSNYELLCLFKDRRASVDDKTTPTDMIVYTY